jgi:hypothetical protein
MYRILAYSQPMWQAAVSRAKPHRPSGLSPSRTVRSPSAGNRIYGQFGMMLPAHRATVSVTAHYQGATTQILDCV